LQNEPNRVTDRDFGRTNPISLPVAFSQNEPKFGSPVAVSAEPTDRAAMAVLKTVGGNVTMGSQDTGATAYEIATGADYRVSPDTRRNIRMISWWCQYVLLFKQN
jgi:hypothetical protein